MWFKADAIAAAAGRIAGYFMGLGTDGELEPKRGAARYRWFFRSAPVFEQRPVRAGNRIGLWHRHSGNVPVCLGTIAGFTAEEVPGLTGRIATHDEEA